MEVWYEQRQNGGKQCIVEIRNELILLHESLVDFNHIV